MKRRVTSVIIATSLLAGQMTGFAAEQAGSSNGLPGKTRESAFEACKDVKLISKSEYEKNKASWDNVKACGGNVQVVEDKNFLGSYTQHDAEVKFLSDVGNTIIGNYEKNIAFMKGLKECYSADKALSAGCADKKALVASKLDEAARKARIELMLSAAKKDSRRDWGMRNNVDAAVNSDARKFQWNIISSLGFPVSDTAASPAELEAAKKIASDEINEAIKKAKVEGAEAQASALASGDSLGSDETARLTAFAQISSEQVAKHQTAYRSIIEDEMPILGQLPKGAIDPKTGKWSWSDAQISAALDGAIKNAHEQEKSTFKTVKEGTVEHYTGVDAYKRSVQKHGDLMSLLVQTPAVESVLKQHPEYCSTALGLADQKWYSDMRYGAATAVGFVAGGVGAGLMLKGGAAVAASAGMFAVGSGMGAYDMARSWSDMKDAQSQINSRTGLAQNGEEAKNREAKDVAEAESATATSWVMNALMGGGGNAVMGVTKAGKALVNGYRAAGSEGMRLVLESAGADVKALLASKFSKMGIVSEDTAKRAIASKSELDSLKKEMYASLLEGKVTDEKVRALDQGAAALANKGSGKAADENRKVLLSAMANPVLTKADEETAQVLSKALFEHLNPEVLTYDREGISGVRVLEDQLRKDIGDLKIKDPVKYSKIASGDEEAVESLAKSSLRKVGAKDDEVDALFSCAFKSAAR